MRYDFWALLAPALFSGLVAADTVKKGSTIISTRQDADALANACNGFRTPTIPGVTVVSVQAAARRGVVVNTSMMTANGPQRVPPLDICDVNVTLSHGTSGDRVRVEVCKSNRLDDFGSSISDWSLTDTCAIRDASEQLERTLSGHWRRRLRCWHVWTGDGTSSMPHHLAYDFP